MNIYCSLSCAYTVLCKCVRDMRMEKKRLKLSYSLRYACTHCMYKMVNWKSTCQIAKHRTLVSKSQQQYPVDSHPVQQSVSGEDSRESNIMHKHTSSYPYTRTWYVCEWCGNKRQHCAVASAKIKNTVRAKRQWNWMYCGIIKCRNEIQQGILIHIYREDDDTGSIFCSQSQRRKRYAQRRKTESTEWIQTARKNII